MSRRGPRGKSSPNKESNKRLRRVTGLHSCEEVLKVRSEAVEEVWLKQGWQRSNQLAEIGKWAERKRVKTVEVTEKKLGELSSGHQGVALFVGETPQVDVKKLAKEGPSRVVLLDGIEDPHNLGAMLRTGWLMEVSAFFATKDRAVGLTPTVCKVASGGVEHIPVDFANNLVQVIKNLKEQGYWVYGLAEAGAKNLYSLEFPEKVAWVIGAEDKGLRGSILKEVDEKVCIPQVETGSSYNASVALAIALSETVRPYKS